MATETAERMECKTEKTRICSHIHCNPRGVVRLDRVNFNHVDLVQAKQHLGRTESAEEFPAILVSPNFCFSISPNCDEDHSSPKLSYLISYHQ